MSNIFLSYDANVELTSRLITTQSLSLPKLFNTTLIDQGFLLRHSLVRRYTGNYSKTSMAEKVLVCKGMMPECSSLRDHNYHDLTYDIDIESRNYFTLKESPDGITIETDYLQSFNNLEGSTNISTLIRDTLLKNMNKLPKFINNYFKVVDVFSEGITDLYIFIGTQRLKNGKEHQFAIINVFCDDNYNLLFNNAANVRNTLIDTDKAKFTAYTTISYSYRIKDKGPIFSNIVPLGLINKLNQADLEKKFKIDKIHIKPNLNTIQNNINNNSITFLNMEKLEAVV
jgi:hypothetical protein